MPATQRAVRAVEWVVPVAVKVGVVAVPAAEALGVAVMGVAVETGVAAC